ncbi:hypothetical protein PsYK624_152100 [Phanerochaete sordida]|uniref:Uncharacterized protein n=1 Tax=Phanerochaete sordida TaxID=48140 RepID=A0A9P3GNV7_9APHY|nr:hypothetical protein PsYK624_152100 [Phanerochaete sordida]
MRHPYDAVQWLRHSLSTDALESWLQLTPEVEVAPQPPLTIPTLYRTSSCQPSLPSDRTSGESLRSKTCEPPIAYEDSRGHFVKHSRWATVLLCGQDTDLPEPEYTNGATIEGILAVPRPSGMLSLQIKVEGSIRLDETAGSGSFESEIVNDLVYEWEAEHKAPFPSEVSFRYTLPTHFMHYFTGERFHLPPSYRVHLEGVPGLKVNISYAVVVYITQTRCKANWWRKSTRLSIPFTYKELSRPTLAGPFVGTLTKSPTIPRTVFQYTVESLSGSGNDIKVELYLAHSQICSLHEPIPFCVTFFAPEEVLRKYTAFRTSPESFHPLASPDGDADGPARGQLFSCFLPTSPVRLNLYRRTQVDVHAAGMRTAAACLARARSDIAATKLLASGVVYNANRDTSSASWSGHILVPRSVGCGGFVARGIRVTDCLVLTLAHPAALRSEYAEFYKSVPIRLTTEAYDASDDVLTISDWSDP